MGTDRDNPSNLLTYNGSRILSRTRPLVHPQSIWGTGRWEGVRESVGDFLTTSLVDFGREPRLLLPGAK